MRFENMISPILIQTVYWAVNVGVALLAFQLWDANPLLAFAVLILGFIVVRVIAEGFMLAFRISQTIADIRDTAIRIRAFVPRVGGSFNDFLTFRHMITPTLIVVVFWILTVLAILAYVAGMIILTSNMDRIPGEAANLAPVIFLGGTIGLIIGILFIRVIAEFFSLAFGVNENLTDIRNSNRAADTASVSNGDTKMEMNDFLTFRRMILPIAIQVLYWLATVAVVFSVLSLLSRLGGALGLLLGIPTLVLGLLFVRIFSEISIVPFRINETLTDIRKLIVRQEGTTTSNNGLSVEDFLTFRRMIGPIIIQALYWIFTALIVVRFFIDVFAPDYDYHIISYFPIIFDVRSIGVLPEPMAALVNLVYGLLYGLSVDLYFLPEPMSALVDLVYGLLVIRVYAEQFLLVFRINGTLTDIRTATTQRTGTTERLSNGYAIGDAIFDFLTFHRMGTPIFIQLFYWLLTAGIVVILAWWAQNFGFLEDGPVRILTVGILLAIGLLAVRIFAELNLLVFRINETLTDIRDAPMSLTGATSTSQQDTTPKKTCPHCARPIPSGAQRCGYCLKRLDGVPQTDTASAQTSMQTCPHCVRSIPSGAQRCGYCLKRLDDVL